MNNGYAICFNEWALDERIKNDIRLLIIISSLTAREGYCFASNQYLAELFNESEQTISNRIKNLEKNNYIEIEYKKRGCEVVERKIRLTKILIDDIKNHESTIYQNLKENITSINNINIYIYYENIFARTLNPIEYEMMTKWLEDKTEEQIKKAIDETAKANIDNLKYVEKVLYGKKNKKVIPEWVDKELDSTPLDDKDFQTFLEEFRK